MNFQNTTLATWAVAIWEALSDAGHDPKQVFDQEGLAYQDLTDAEARVPIATMTNVWHRCVDVTGDAAFGLRVPHYRSALTFHGVGIALEASDTIGSALDRLVKLSHLVSDVADISYELNDQGQCLMHWHIEPESRKQVAHEAMDAFMHSWCMNLSVGDLIEVRMVRDRPKDPAPWYSAFSNNLIFNANEDMIVFKASVLTTKAVSPNQAVAQAGEQVALDYLRRMSLSSFKLRVEAEIRARLESGEPKQVQVAEALCMSSRQLQRKLADEGTSFVEILKNIRYQLACDYLKDHTRSITDISLTLGFRDQSNFASAFKRWHGSSPSQYRNEIS